MTACPVIAETLSVTRQTRTSSDRLFNQAIRQSFTVYWTADSLPSVCVCVCVLLYRLRRVLKFRADEPYGHVNIQLPGAG